MEKSPASSSSEDYYEQYYQAQQPNHSRVLSPAAAASISPAPISPYTIEVESPSDQLQVAIVQQEQQEQEANPRPVEQANGERRQGNGNPLPGDSAYNSEHEHTPEQSEAAAAAAAAAAAQASGKKITATMLDDELWKSFHKIGNEMIVTKPGRRLFPSLVVTLRGLKSSQEYNITLKVAPADPYRYKFLNMQWSMVGDSEVNQNEARQLYLHPSSPNIGSFWMKKPISFRSIKITHNPNSKNGNILLHTMHKYVLQIIVSPINNSGDTVLPLEETTFVAVSAYQNTTLTQLKIDNNPFAKGFRDRLRAVAYQPHVQSCSFASGMPAIQFYSGEGYKTPMQVHQLQPAPLQLQPQSLPMQPLLGIGCSQASAITGNLSTAESFSPVVPSPMLPSYGSTYASQLMPLYSNPGYSFYSQPPIGGLNLPSSSPE